MELDDFDAVMGVSFVTFCPFVGIVIPEDGIATDFSEMEAILPSTRMFLIRCLPDGDVDDVPIFDVQPVFDGRVGRHQPPYVIPSIAISLWREPQRDWRLFDCHRLWLSSDTVS